MKKLRISLARTIWAIDGTLLNPDGRSLLDCYHALAKRYRFSKWPQHLMDFNKDNALEFTSGTFIKGKHVDLRVGLTIYNNAIVGDSLSSTDDSELFLQDAAKWAEKEYDLPIIRAIIRKSYVSHVDVKFDGPVQIVNPRLNFIQDRLNSQATSIEGNNHPFGFGGLALWTQDVHTPRGIVFRLEHKHETDFSENIYYANAPMQTKDHLALLEDIEKAATTQ